MNNIFISGLGINGKSSLIQNLKDRGFRTKSSKTTEFMNLLIDTELAWNGTPVLFMKLVDFKNTDYTICDRSMIDHLLIHTWVNSGWSSMHYTNKIPLTENKIREVLRYLYTPDYRAKHFLIKVNDDEFVSKVIESEVMNDGARSYVYKNISEYRECEDYFLKSYMDLCSELDLDLEYYEFDRIQDTPDLLTNIDNYLNNEGNISRWITQS